MWQSAFYGNSNLLILEIFFAYQLRSLHPTTKLSLSKSTLMVALKPGSSAGGRLIGPLVSGMKPSSVHGRIHSVSDEPFPSAAADA
jgi:hypothetical protein